MSQGFFQRRPLYPRQVSHCWGKGRVLHSWASGALNTHAVCFWCRGVLSRCRGVVTTTFWLHTGVDVSEGLSSSSVSCLFQKFKNCQGRPGKQDKVMTSEEGKTLPHSSPWLL